MTHTAMFWGHRLETDDKAFAALIGAGTTVEEVKHRYPGLIEATKRVIAAVEKTKVEVSKLTYIAKTISAHPVSLRESKVASETIK